MLIINITKKLTLGLQSSIKVVHQNSSENDGNEKHDDGEHG